MIQLVTNLMTAFRGILQTGIVLVAIFALTTTFLKTRSLVPTLVAGLTGGLAIWFAFNMDTTVKDKVNKDLNTPTGAPVQIVDIPDPGVIVVVRRGV